MPGPNEFMGLSRPPNSVDYAAPLAGFQIGDRLAGLPDIAQKYQERNAFPNGLKNPDGSPMNYMDIMNRGAQVSGTGAMNYISPLLQMQMYTQAGAGAAGELERGSPPPLGGGASAPQAGSPAAAQPQAAASPKTVGAYLREAGLKDPEIAQFASKFGVSPGAPMAGNVASTITSALDAFMRGGAAAQTPASAVGASEVNQPAQAASATEQGANFSQRFATAGPQGTAGAPAVPTSGASGSPAPVGGPDGGPSPQPSRATPFMPAAKPQGPQPGQPGTQPAAPAAGGGPRMAQAQQTTDLNPLKQLFPGASDPMAAAHARLRELDQGISNAATVGTRYGKIDPAAATMAKAKMEGYQAERKSIVDAMVEAGKPTTEQKNIASGAAQEDLRIKSQQKRSDAVYGGVTAQASQYERDLKPLNQLARSILNTPEMYTGIGSNASLNWNKIAAIYGDNKAAMLQEALKKVTAGSVLAQLNTQRDQLQEAGSNSSRIFSAQVDLVQQAATEAGTTLGGNRFLIETSDRLGALSLKVAEMAREYMGKHGVLDVGFDQKLSDHMKNNPVFTKDELSHPEWIGAPTIPPAVKTKPQLADWERRMGLKKGEVIRTPKGDYVQIP